eukprot:3907740-Rhodomonas_salina.1
MDSTGAKPGTNVYHPRNRTLTAFALSGPNPRRVARRAQANGGQDWRPDHRADHCHRRRNWHIQRVHFIQGVSFHLRRHLRCAMTNADMAYVAPRGSLDDEKDASEGGRLRLEYYCNDPSSKDATPRLPATLGQSPAVGAEGVAPPGWELTKMVNSFVLARAGHPARRPLPYPRDPQDGCHSHAGRAGHIACLIGVLLLMRAMLTFWGAATKLFHARGRAAGGATEARLPAGLLASLRTRMRCDAMRDAEIICGGRISWGKARTVKRGSAGWQ